MKFGSYDLHCHSNCSDGTKTPFELIEMAKKIGLKGICITDHDTVSAYTVELFAFAKEKEIELIIGAEFSCNYQKNGGFEPIHILGYGLDCKNQKLLDFCNNHKTRRKQRCYKIVEKLKHAGYDVTDEIKDVNSLGRPHIALALIKKGYVGDMESAFKKFLGEKAPFFIYSSLPTIEETISTIKIAGGKAILAHPILIKGKKILRKIISFYDFDGIECYYGNFPRDKIAPFLEICKEKNLLITGGSDYHGDNKSYLNLGSSFVKEEIVRKLLSTLN
jgi:predicted metal-dependent phosphoesterase TrpH